MENKENIVNYSKVEIAPVDATPREIASYETGFLVGHHIGYWLAFKHLLIVATGFILLWTVLRLLFVR